MGATIINVLLALIEEVLPLILGSSTNATAIDKVIDAIKQLIPFLTQEFADIVPRIQAIIDVLKADPTTSQAQLASLMQTEVDLDKQFDDAESAAEAADSAAGNAAT